VAAEGRGKAGHARRFGRRNVLRGAGVALALPWLEALAPRSARGQAAALPRRFLPISFPCGVPSFWWPQAEGSGDGWQLTSVLEPLTPLKPYVTLLNHLENGSVFNADGSSSVEPSHGRLAGAFLSCVDSDQLRHDLAVPGSPDLMEANGVSVDQVLAQARKGETRIDSLQVGLATILSSCDGKPCSLSRSISWATQTKPLYKEIDPKKVFDTLFGSPDLPGPSKSRRDKSVLDAVLESSKALDAKLSVKDRQILDQYLTSIRDTEQRLTTSACATAPERPQMVVHQGLRNGQEGYDRNQHCDLMNQLIALAFQCDLTRVISYMLEDERSEFVYDHVPVRNFTLESSTPGTPGLTCGELHGAGQSSGEQTGVWDSITRWHTLKVSELCQKLASFPEGDGSVLDNTVVLYGSCMHGADHSAADLPLALIGGKSMLKGDRFLSVGPRSPLRDVHYTLLKGCFELELESFGESKMGAPQRFLSELLP
jgi:hypothetical protein